MSKALSKAYTGMAMVNVQVPLAHLTGDNAMIINAHVERLRAALEWLWIDSLSVTSNLNIPQVKDTPENVDLRRGHIAAILSVLTQAGVNDIVLWNNQDENEDAIMLASMTHPIVKADKVLDATLDKLKAKLNQEVVNYYQTLWGGNGGMLQVVTMTYDQIRYNRNKKHPVAPLYYGRLIGISASDRDQVINKYARERSGSIDLLKTLWPNWEKSVENYKIVHQND